MAALAWNSSTWSRVARPAALLAVILAALLCVWTAVRLTWQLLVEVPVANAAISAPSAPPTAPAKIAQWHLFGDPAHSLREQQILTARRETELKLSLHGTFATPQPTAGWALIADEHGTERGYRVGEALPGDVRLQAVYADHVVIDNHGSPENLSLPREQLKQAPSVSEQAAGAHDERSAADRGGIPAGGTPSGVRSTRRGTDGKALYVPPQIANGKVDWQSARAHIGAEAVDALERAQIQPALQNGRIVGVRLTGTAGVPLLGKLGLKPDDVVTAVNGVPLDSPSRGQQLFEQLKNARHVDVSILRNGRPQNLSVDLDHQR